MLGYLIVAAVGLIAGLYLYTRITSIETRLKAAEAALFIKK